MTSHTKIASDMDRANEKAAGMLVEPKHHRLLNLYLKAYNEKLCISDVIDAMVPKGAKRTLVDYTELQKERMCKSLNKDPEKEAERIAKETKANKNSNARARVDHG